MLSFFKKKKIIPHIKLNGVIGNVGKFKQGIDFAGQEEIIKKAFSIKKAPAVAISINSPGGSPVQSHLIHDFIRSQAKKNNIISYDRLIENKNLAKVSIVGIGMKTHAGVAQKMFETLSEENININVISTSEIKLSVLIERKYLELAVRSLHDAFGLQNL